MAPEVLRPSLRHAGEPADIITYYDQSCDVYSFAFVLYEVMHERLAFSEISSREVYRLVAQGIRPPIALPADRAGFGEIISTMWAQSAQVRPAMPFVMERIVAFEATLESSEGLEEFSPMTTTPGAVQASMQANEAAGLRRRAAGATSIAVDEDGA